MNITEIQREMDALLKISPKKRTVQQECKLNSLRAQRWYRNNRSKALVYQARRYQQRVLLAV